MRSLSEGEGEGALDTDRKTKISFKQLTDTAEEKREERKKRVRTKQAAAMKDKKQTKQQEQVKPEGRN